MLVQVAQHAADLGRAAEFYTLLLGIAPAARFDPPGMVFFDLDGTRLLLDPNAPPALLYLRVDDLDAVLAGLAAAGIEIVSQPQVVFTHPDGTLGPVGAAEWQAFVRDSEGNLVGLVEWR